MLKPHGPEEIESLAARCDKVAKDLRVLIGKMLVPGPKTLQLNGKKASDYLTHLQDWTDGITRKHRKIRDKVIKDLAAESHAEAGKARGRQKNKS